MSFRAYEHHLRLSINSYKLSESGIFPRVTSGRQDHRHDGDDMSSFSEEGFLSDEGAVITEVIRSDYMNWLVMIRAINKTAVELQYTLAVNEQSARDISGVALFMRTIIHVQAAVLLLERGLEAPAKVMVRCAMEGLFNLGACANDSGKALAFLDADVAGKKRVARYLLQVQDPRIKEIVSEAVTQEQLEHIERTIENLKARELQTREMAKAADLEDMYLTSYAHLSGSVHSSARDLEQHFEIDANGHILALTNEPVVKELEILFAMLGEVLIAAIRAVAKICVLEVEDICRVHAERLGQMWALRGAG